MIESGRKVTLKKRLTEAELGRRNQSTKSLEGRYRSLRR